MFEVTVSVATICRTLNFMNCTQQVIQHIPVQYRISMCDTSMLIWIDKSGCDRHHSTWKWGYSLRGMPARDHWLLVRGTRCFAIPVMSLYLANMVVLGGSSVFVCIPPTTISPHIWHCISVKIEPCFFLQSLGLSLLLPGCCFFVLVLGMCSSSESASLCICLWLPAAFWTLSFRPLHHIDILLFGFLKVNPEFRNISALNPDHLWSLNVAHVSIFGCDILMQLPPDDLLRSSHDRISPVSILQRVKALESFVFLHTAFRII